MVYSGEPIGQPVAVGPFVMNSASEVEQALRDFHSGGFGDILNQARLQFRWQRGTRHPRLPRPCARRPGAARTLRIFHLRLQLKQGEPRNAARRWL
ncbi:pirin-like C-terminal cupin domain-containing protein [Streptomyces avermitilis]